MNIHEVANEAGVSVATVSRVLNGKPNVKGDVQYRVIEIAKRMGYSPKSLVATNKIPLIVENLKTRALGLYENMLIMELLCQLTERNFSLEIISLHELSLLQEKFSRVAFALVYMPESLALLQRCEIPLITINSPLNRAINVYSDHFQGVYDATSFLLQQGHRCIGLVNSHVRNWGMTQRVAGYRAALDKYNVVFDENLLLDDSHNQSPVELTASIMRLNPTALIAAGEEMAMSTHYALNLLGRKIPDDISFIAFENPYFSRYTAPPHTTIAQPLAQIAAAAVDKATAVLAGDVFVPENLVFQNTLIRRDTVKSIVVS